jgi:hypothetical protein
MAWLFWNGQFLVSSVAVTPNIESRLNKLTSNTIRLDSTRLGQVEVTRSRASANRVGPDPSVEALANGINHFEIVRPRQNISQEWPRPKVRPKLGQISVVQHVRSQFETLIPVRMPQHWESTFRNCQALPKYLEGMATCHHSTMCALKWVRSVWWSMANPKSRP